MVCYKGFGVTMEQAANENWDSCLEVSGAPEMSWSSQGTSLACACDCSSQDRPPHFSCPAAELRQADACETFPLLLSGTTLKTAPDGVFFKMNCTYKCLKVFEWNRETQRCDRLGWPTVLVLAAERRPGQSCPLCHLHSQRAFSYLGGGWRFVVPWRVALVGISRELHRFSGSA